MQVNDLLRTLRTRWPSIALITVLAVLAAWILLPDKLAEPKNRPGARATSVLVLDTTGATGAASKPGANQLNTLKVIASGGEVPAQVAAELGITVPELRSRVTINSSPTDNSLSIVAVDRTAQAATKIAETYSTKLLTVLIDQAKEAQAVTRSALIEQIDKLEADRALLEVTAKTDPSAKPGVDALGRLLNTNQAKLSALNGAPPRAPLRSIGPPTVQRLTTSRGAETFLHLPVRLSLAGVFGFLAAVLGLTLLDRFDIRLRTKQAAELAFGLPVLAEVPALPSKRRSTAAMASDPNGPYAEAHRILRTAVLSSDPAVGSGRSGRARSCMIVVTSADPAEGKTATAVNLAASFAEAGSDTLLVGLDLRHNDLRSVVPPSPSSDVYLPTEGGGGREVHVAVSETGIPGLRLVTMEPPFGPPAIVLPVVAAWLRDLKGEVDAIVVDTPPLLVCNDTSEVIPYADTVLIACRAGFTTAEATERAAESLARLRAPVCGVVLVGAKLRAQARKVSSYGAGAWASAMGMRKDRDSGSSGPGAPQLKPPAPPSSTVTAADDAPDPAVWPPPDPVPAAVPVSAPVPDDRPESDEQAAAMADPPVAGSEAGPVGLDPVRPGRPRPGRGPAAEPSGATTEASWRPVPIPLGGGPTAVRRTLDRAIWRITGRRSPRP